MKKGKEKNYGGHAPGDLTSVNIRPGVSILSVLQHLNYRPWYALAEFVDNSIQSYISNRAEIDRIDEGKPGHCRVDIELDPIDGGRLVVRDNAAGIRKAEYSRAFRPAEVPPDTTGLCEFGMGMKTAACWFAKHWTVRTSALNEKVERTVTFDVRRIVQDELEELTITQHEARRDAHFTEIVLTGLNHSLHGRTVGKIREHLASIYRVFLREGLLRLTFNGDPLTYEEPEVMVAPHYKELKGQTLTWRKDISFDFGQGQRVSGFAGLRTQGSTSLAGFALFRRRRLIQGSADDTYRPELIFGKSNSYRYQRLFGELHLEGFDISHTKDGFQWDDNEDVFLELLKEHLEGDPLNLLDQAEGHRIRQSKGELISAAQGATNRTADAIGRDVPPVLERQIDAEPDSAPPPAELTITTGNAARREIDFDLAGQSWQVVVETTADPAISEWISISDCPSFTDARTGVSRRRVSVRMSLAHPFMDRFCGADSSTIEALLRVAAALGLAQVAARDAGAKLTSTIIRNVNELLRNGLANA